MDISFLQESTLQESTCVESTVVESVDVEVDSDEPEQDANPIITTKERNRFFIIFINLFSLRFQ